MSEWPSILMGVAESSLWIHSPQEWILCLSLGWERPGGSSCTMPGVTRPGIPNWCAMALQCAMKFHNLDINDLRLFLQTFMRDY
jgi:hypothetical protein